MVWTFVAFGPLGPFSLVDGVRIGDARVRGVAAELLHARLAEVPA